MNTLLKPTPYVQPHGLPNRHLGSVDRALKKTGQRSFRPASVDAYRREVARRFLRQNPLTKAESVLVACLCRNVTLIKLHMMSTLLACLGGLGTVGLSLLYATIFHGSRAVAMIAGTGGLLFLLSLPFVIIYAGLEKKKIGQWKRVPLRAYAYPLPEPVLATVMELVRFCPDAQERMVVDVFMVDDLPDPILGIQNDRTGQIHWLEAWNEPLFMQERVAL